MVVGDEGIKTLVGISVLEVVLHGVLLDGKSVLSLSFQRGLKHVSSKEREALLKRGQDLVLASPFGNDTLSLVTTLVRDSHNGVFREKHAKLVLRRAKPGVLGFHTGFQGIAVALLPLHSLLADYSMQKVSLTLVDCTGCASGTMSVVLNPKFISEVRPPLFCFARHFLRPRSVSHLSPSHSRFFHSSVCRHR